MNETALRNSVLLAISKLGARLFRNNTGQAWIGKSERVTAHGQIFRLHPGDVVIRNARPLHAGLVKGGSDLVGWSPVKIMEEDVGKTFAIFTALELKTGKLQATPEQANFIEQIQKAGGIAGIVRSPDMAAALLDVGPIGARPL